MERWYRGLVGGLDLNLFDAKAGVGLLVLDGLLIALSAFGFENLLESTLGVFGDDGSDANG